MTSPIRGEDGLKNVEATSAVFLAVGPDISKGENMKPVGRSSFGTGKGEDLGTVGFMVLYERVSRAEKLAVVARCKSLLLSSWMLDLVSVVQEMVSELK